TVEDAGGNPVAGQAVALTSSDAGEQLGTVSDHGDGTYIATITSSATGGPANKARIPGPPPPGPATIIATDTTPAPSISGQGTLYQYGPASNVTVALNPPSVVADGSSTATATATVTDAEGDPVPGETITFASGSGNQVGAVTDNH